MEVSAIVSILNIPFFDGIYVTDTAWVLTVLEALLSVWISRRGRSADLVAVLEAWNAMDVLTSH